MNQKTLPDRRDYPDPEPALDADTEPALEADTEAGDDAADADYDAIDPDPDGGEAVEGFPADAVDKFPDTLFDDLPPARVASRGPGHGES